LRPSWESLLPSSGDGVDNGDQIGHWCATFVCGKLIDVVADVKQLAVIKATPGPPEGDDKATTASSERSASATRSRRPAVGRQVRAWRTDRGLTLAQVAQRTGLNIGYLSQIENDKASPSLDALATLADALDVPISWFLIEGTEPPRVVRANERPVIEGPDGARAERVDGGRSRDISIIQGSAAPGQRTGGHAHSGDEHHVVLAGRWRMTQGDHVVELGPGDYLAWDASLPHDVEALGPEPGSMLVVTLRGSGSELSRPGQRPIRLDPRRASSPKEDTPG
jgi:transcriptional regulator with XRE-family HTH domain